jgi:hypothetical protein
VLKGALDHWKNQKMTIRRLGFIVYFPAVNSRASACSIAPLGSSAGSGVESVVLSQH